MSEIKGYVVRGKEAARLRADVFYVGDGDFAYADSEEQPMVLETTDAALSAQVGMKDVHGFTDARIFAVAEDGTETPLLTYEEALAEVGEAHAALDEVVARCDAGDGSTLSLSVRAVTATKIVAALVQRSDAALALIKRLRAERALWMRLVKAERAHHDQTDLLGERDDDMKGAWGEVDAARQALRELGVDVDVLLKLQETEEGRNR